MSTTAPEAAPPARPAPPPPGSLTALLAALPRAVGDSARQVLHIVLVRYLVALLRYVYYVGVRRRLRVFSASGEAVAPNTVSHNRRGMTDLSVARSDVLIRPLSVIDRVARRKSQVRVLCVGPRTEGELLNLVAYGFPWKNIRGLDLISYSPKIDLGDMHAMPYADGTWDVIVFGWVLSYSDDRLRAAQELVRVARDGAVVAVGIEYCPHSVAEIKEQLGYVPGSDTRIASVDELLSYFAPSVGTVYVRHDVDPELRDQIGAIYAIFSVKK